MNKLIKNAIIFSAELPNPVALEHHLYGHRFTPPTALDWKRAGFVNAPHIDELVATFAGGVAFSVRIDEKILPASVIRSELEATIKRLEETEGRRISRKEKQALKEQITDNLLAKALVKTAVVTCFYHAESKYLIVPVSSKKLADTITSLLVHAVGSIKTTTINISDVKLGLTTKVKEWLADELGESSPFGDRFAPGGKVKLVNAAGDKAVFDVAGLDSARAGINDAIEKQFAVAELGMGFDATTEFRLTADFHLKGIKFAYEPYDAGDAHELWEMDAYAQVAELVELVKAMCDLLGYREQENAEVVAAE